MEQNNVLENTIEEITINNFEIWNEALQTRDAKEVAKLYSKNATFLPTMLGEFLLGNQEDGVEKYFEHFLEKDPLGKIIEGKIQEVNSDLYVHSGHYDFEVGHKDKRETVHARFTFIWEKINGDWRIIHHHSSLKPQN